MQNRTLPQIFIRPPETVVPGGFMFYCWCLFIYFLLQHEISELPRPIWSPWNFATRSEVSSIL